MKTKQKISLLIAFVMLMGFFITSPLSANAITDDRQTYTHLVDFNAPTAAGYEYTFTYSSEVYCRDSSNEYTPVATATPTGISRSIRVCKYKDNKQTQLEFKDDYTFSFDAASKTFTFKFLNELEKETNYELTAEFFYKQVDEEGNEYYLSFHSLGDYAGYIVVPGEITQEIIKVNGVVVPNSVVAETNVASATAFIDMTNEKLFVNDFKVAAYSLDGGTKWKAGSLGSASGVDISKLLNKGFTLKLASLYDEKNKKPKDGVADATSPVTGATIIEFVAVKPRPKMEKYDVNYLAFQTFSEKIKDGNMDYVETDSNFWCLTTKGTDTIAYKNLELATTKDKKTADNNGWSNLMDDYSTATSIEAADVYPNYNCLVKQPGENGKSFKTTYLVRTAPIISETEIVPASKPVKYNVSSLDKAPKLKIDYKKEVIKLKAGMCTDLVYEEKAIIIDGRELKSYVYPIITKENIKKEGYNINEDSYERILKDGSKCTDNILKLEFTVAVAPTAKKPGSVTVNIYPAERAEHDLSTPTSISAIKGKIKPDKKYEFLDTVKQKWGGLPKIDAVATEAIKVRLKQNVKSNNEIKTMFIRTQKDKQGNVLYWDADYILDDTGSGYAASYIAGLTYNWGEIDAKGKMGILNATIFSLE